MECEYYAIISISITSTCLTIQIKFKNLLYELVVVDGIERSRGLPQIVPDGEIGWRIAADCSRRDGKIGWRIMAAGRADILGEEPWNPETALFRYSLFFITWNQLLAVCPKCFEIWVLLKKISHFPWPFPYRIFCLERLPLRTSRTT